MPITGADVYANWWNDIDWVNQRTGIKNCRSATLSNTNHAWTGLGSKPGLLSEMPVN